MVYFCQDELNRANDDMIKRKVQKKEQEKLLDLKVLEFQRQKAVCTRSVALFGRCLPCHMMISPIYSI